MSAREHCDRCCVRCEHDDCVRDSGDTCERDSDERSICVRDSGDTCERSNCGREVAVHLATCGFCECCEQSADAVRALVALGVDELVYVCLASIQWCLPTVRCGDARCSNDIVAALAGAERRYGRNHRAICAAVPLSEAEKNKLAGLRTLADSELSELVFERQAVEHARAARNLDQRLAPIGCATSHVTVHGQTIIITGGLGTIYDEDNFLTRYREYIARDSIASSDLPSLPEIRDEFAAAVGMDRRRDSAREMRRRADDMLARAKKLFDTHNKIVVYASISAAADSDIPLIETREDKTGLEPPPNYWRELFDCV